MVVVTHTLTSNAGLPLAGVECRVDIMPPFAFVTATGTQITDAVWATSDDDGLLSFEIAYPNDLITPIDSYYVYDSPYTDDPRLQFRAPSGFETVKLTDYLVEVPDSQVPIAVGVSEAELAQAIAALGAGVVGKDGQPRYAGMGPPPDFINGASPGDIYIDATNGDLYQDQ